MKNISDFIKKATGKEASFLDILLVFSGVVFLRIIAEQFIARSAPISTYETVIEYIHNFYFFSLSFILIGFMLKIILKDSFSKIMGMLLPATLLVLLPPLIDMVRTGGEVYWSFYSLSTLRDMPGQFVTFFGNLPPGIRYFGTKIVFFLALTLVGGLVFIKRRKLLLAVISSLGTYGILFLMGNFPGFFTFFYKGVIEGKDIFSIKSFEIAQFVGSPSSVMGIKAPGISYAFPYKLEFIYFLLLIILLATGFYWHERKKFWSFCKNARFPQLIYHGGLFLVGAGLGFLRFGENLKFDIFSLASVVVLEAVFVLAWLASVVVNDIYDLEIDRITNSDRPLPQNVFSLEEYRNLGAILFFLSVLGGLTVGFSFAALAITYQILAWFYSAPPLRLKKYPVIATFTSSLASLMVVFSGYILLSTDQGIHSLSWRIILLLIVAYTLSLPIKDFKDIEGDKKDQVWTWPVILGERKGRLFVSISLFISSILPVFFLHEPKLFPWALFFGSILYLAINSKKIKSRQIPGAVLGVVFFYLLVIIRVVFWF
jgi:4-hydroxybenzoate polyprenyltransferase